MRKLILLSSLLLVQSSLLFSQNPTSQTTTPPPPPTREADSLFLHLNYKEALKKYQQYILNTPTAIPIAYARMGYSYHNLGQYDEALKAYHEAIKRNPAPGIKPFLYSRMVMTYSRKKDRKNALLFLDSANANSYSNVYEMEHAADYDFIRSEKRFKEIYDAATLRAYPCMSIARARDLDFWIGEWEVYNNASPFQQVGINIIERASGGCVLVENWNVLNGAGNGKSFNYYDTATKKWTQLWIGHGGGQQFYTDGEFKDGVMRFKYQTTGPQNQPVTGNFYFYDLGPNKVRQYQDASTDGGKTFQISYDFIYIRKGAKAR